MPMFRPPQWRHRIRKLMLDPVRSAVEIALDGTVAAVPVLGGTLTRLPDSWAGAEISLVLDASDVQSGDPASNERLRSARIFDVANHPRVGFRGHVVRPASADHFDIPGILTLRNRQLPLTLCAQDLGERDGAHRISASATLRSLPCRDDRTAWTACDLISHTAVDIVIHAEWLTVQDPLPAA